MSTVNSKYIRFIEQDLVSYLPFSDLLQIMDNLPKIAYTIKKKAQFRNTFCHKISRYIKSIHKVCKFGTNISHLEIK